MKIFAPATAPAVALKDVNDKIVRIGTPGKQTLLCFFRDPSCPFCNFRVFELTNRYPELSALGLDIIAVFAASPNEVKRFAAARPRPFSVIADVDSVAYTAYGVARSSLLGKLKAMIMRMPTLIRGLRIVGAAGLNTTNLMPADFLIDEKGNIVETWYGKDAGDRIPFTRIENFLTGKTFHSNAVA